MCETLKVKVKNLTKSLEEFINDKKNLNTLQAIKDSVSTKKDWVMNKQRQKVFLKNFFVRKPMGNEPHITYYYCGQIGHGIDSCAHKKGTYVPSACDKLVWIVMT